jgi:hypothetical protein
MAGAMLDVVIDTTNIGKALGELAERLGDLTIPTQRHCRIPPPVH